MSETFRPRCSFGTTRRFRISPASYVDLTQTFSRRGFPSLPCLRRCVKYLTNVQSPKEKGRELQISSQFDAIFSTATRAFVCKFVCQSTSVVHFHWSRLARDHFRILHYLLTYLHFDDKVSTALPRSRHKNSLLVCRELSYLPLNFQSKQNCSLQVNLLVLLRTQRSTVCPVFDGHTV